MNAILITGGAGYIGSHVCKALRKKGFTPITFDNFSQGHKESVRWGPCVKGDLLDPKNLEAVFTTYKPIAVMHFAAHALVGESVQFPEKYYRNNVTGTLNLLQACLTHQVKHVVFSSTCAIYGSPSTVPIHEMCPTKPINPYGKSKLMVEEILQDYQKAYGINSVSLRYFNAAGADSEGEIGEDHAPETHLIPLVIQAALGILPHIAVFGTDFPTFDGSAIRDYIHVQDLANAHILALLWLLENSQSLQLNLGTGKGLSVLEIIKAVELHAKKFIRIQLESRRAGDPPILIADNRKAKEILGWEPKYSDVDTIIATAWQWHEKHQLVLR